MLSTHRLPIVLVVSVLAAFFAGCSDDATAPPGGPYSLIESYAGNGFQGLGEDGLPPQETSLYWPQDITFGPDGKVYILDWNNHRIRVVESGVTHTLCGTGYLGDAPAGYADEISLNHPTHVSLDGQGNLIISAWHNSKVLHLDNATNWVQPIAGTGARSFSGDGGPATEAALDLPVATLTDDDGRLLIMDQANQCIRRVENGIITTFAGTPKTPGFAGDDGPPSLARFNFPTGQSAPPSGRMSIDSSGKIYVADTGNNRIRVIEPEEALPGAVSFAHSDYIVRTIAGTGERGFAGENVPALEAKLELPSDVDVDSQGNVYVVDTFNHCVRKIDTNGIITTFAGKPNSTWSGDYDPDASVGDGGLPTRAVLNRPYGIAIDFEDNVYIADTYNNRIRVVWKDPEAHR